MMNMLKTVKGFFEKKISTDASDDVYHRLKLATAALLVEIMCLDQRVLEKERQAVRRILRDKFSLTEDESRELYDLARQEAEDAVDYHEFTRLIARECSLEEKTRIVENLWTIAYADSHLDALEEHVIRRIADLIYLPHREFIKAKHRAAGGKNHLQVVNDSAPGDE